MRNKTRLLTPGPTPIPESIRLAMAKDMIHHRKADFQKILERTKSGLAYLFGTQTPVLILGSVGSGAMTAATTNLFAPGERVLVVEAGKFGQRWGEICEMAGLEVIRCQIDWGKAADPQALEKILNEDSSITGLFVQVSETSTGVLHPIREIAATTRGRNVLLVADGISAVGISPCPMDEWGIDCLLTGSQKGLMLPPGLAFIALSDRAWEKTLSLPVRDFYFNLPAERKNQLKNQTLFTSNVSLIVALEHSLNYFTNVGLEEIYTKQWALTCLAREGIAALGLELLAAKNFTWGLTSVKLPEGIDGKKILETALKDYGVVMAGGQDHLAGKIVRIGHMGYVDFGDLLAGLYSLRGALLKCGGYSGSDNYLERAMAAYESALVSGPPLTHSV